MEGESCNIGNTSHDRNPGTTGAARRLIPNARREAENRAISRWRRYRSEFAKEKEEWGRIRACDAVKYFPNGVSIHLSRDVRTRTTL